MSNVSNVSMTKDEIREVGSRLDGAYPEDVLKWAVEKFGDGIAMATGFGPSGVSLMHMLSRVRRDATVFYLDTDLLFPETHDLKRVLADRLGIQFTRVHSGLSLPNQSKEEGANLWRSNPDRCCFLRKVQPLRRFLATKDAWITGIRRDQSPTRRGTGVVEWDRTHELVKVNPLATWTEKQVWQYIELHDLPYNVLHDRGYPSVGCIPCTKPVQDGDDPRAGRWQGHEKLECGIHGSDDVAYRKSA